VGYYVLKKLLIVYAVLLLLPFVVGEVQTLGTFKQGKALQLIQICDNCTYNNISSVLYPNGTIALTNSTMVRSGTSYTRQFNLTNDIGQYIVNGFGDLDGQITVWSYNFYINKAGSEFTTAQSIMYMFLMCVLLIFFAGSLYGFIRIPGKHRRGQMNQIIAINKMRYLKTGFFALAYLFLMWIIFLSWNISYGFLQLGALATSFYYLYRLMFAISFPLFALTVIIMVVMYINDKNLYTKLQRGLTVE